MKTENPNVGIVVTDLTRSFGEIKALQGISFTVAQGEFLSIFGPNGAGKTTLLRIIASLISPTSGTVTLFGHSRSDIRRLTGFVSHATFLYGDLSIFENLLFYARLYRIDDPMTRIEEVMALFGLLERRRQIVRTLSRGFQQRVALARAILHDPPVLLLDEPFTGLDPQSRERFAGLLQNLHRPDKESKKSEKSGKTVVMITHEIHQGFALSDRLLIQSGGKIACSALVSELTPGAFEELYRKHAGG